MSSLFFALLVLLEVCHFLLWSLQWTSSLLIDFSTIFSVCNFISALIFITSCLLLVLGLFCSSRILTRELTEIFFFLSNICSSCCIFPSQLYLSYQLYLRYILYFHVVFSFLFSSMYYFGFSLRFPLWPMDYLEVCCLVFKCLEIFLLSFCYWFPICLYYNFLFHCYFPFLKFVSSMFIIAY